MNHRETHDHLVDLSARIRLMRAVFTQERDELLAYAATLTAVLEVLVAQELEVHESMRDLDDEQLTR